MTILCYHAVDPEWRSPLSVSPDAFAEHCAWLARARTVLPLDAAVHALDRTARLPGGASALTFDDGFASLHRHALPALRRHGLPATVFVVAETLAPSGRVVDWVVPAPAVPPATLDREQVLEMQEAGFAIGSHSYAHRDLTELGDAECEQDLRASRELLEEMLGRPVRHLAYPRGRHNARVRRAAERAGFTHAFTLPEGPEPVGPHAIPRAGVYPGNAIWALRVKSHRSYLPLRRSRAFPALRALLRRPANRWG